MERPQVKESRFELRVRYRFQLVTGFAWLILVFTLIFAKYSVWFALALGLLLLTVLAEILLSLRPLDWKITYGEDLIRFRTMTGWKEIKSEKVQTLVSFKNKSIKLIESGGRSYYFGDLYDSALHLLELARFCRENDLSFNMEGELPEHSGWKIKTHLTRAVNWNWKGTVAFENQGRLNFEKVAQEVSIKDDVLILRRAGIEVMTAPLADCEIIKTSNGAITEGDFRLLVEVKGQGRWPLVDWNSIDYAEVVYVLTDRGVTIREDSGEPLGSNFTAKSRAVPEA